MPSELKGRLPTAALAFRGYNVTNLGRSAELLGHAAYGPIAERFLRDAGQVCAEVTGHGVDLVDRVRRREETTLPTYHEAIALIVALELAQLRLLEEFFGIQYRTAKVAFGYSLGEVTAVCAGGVVPMDDALRIPLAMAADCAELAGDVKMGILFARGMALDLHAVNRLCVQINSEQRGVMGISSYLSPNSLLLLGQRDTVARFRKAMRDTIPRAVHLRTNPDCWPPLHTPIMWERHIPNRAAMMMHAVAAPFTPPQPPVLSMVTGKVSYNDYNWREILNRWTDHPQRLWDVVYETMSMGIKTVIHVGPQPNLIPATFHRLADNVRLQTTGVGRLGVRAMAGMARRPWLARLLPSRSALLRAPHLAHVMLEDWLLDQPVA